MSTRWRACIPARHAASRPKPCSNVKRGGARVKGLWGPALDPLGCAQERRRDRPLIVEYRRSIEELLPTLSAQNLDLALEVARIPEEIRGYGHVKARNAA